MKRGIIMFGDDDVLAIQAIQPWENQQRQRPVPSVEPELAPWWEERRGRNTTKILVNAHAKENNEKILLTIICLVVVKEKATKQTKNKVSQCNK